MLRFRDVHKAHTTPLLQGVDLCVDRGAVVLCAGAMGAGKTTLLELAFGRARADAGTIELFGRDLARLRRSSWTRMRRRLALVPQTLELLGDRSIRANLALPLQVRAEPRRVIRRRVTAMLQRVGMTAVADRPAGRLALGEQQLLALARALIARPELLLADEPTAHLDTRGCDVAIGLLRDAQSQGCSVLLTSNDTRVLHAGALLGWSHVELVEGAIQVVADRTELAFVARSPEANLDQPASLDLNVGVDVIRFPQVAQTGGLAE